MRKIAKIQTQPKKKRYIPKGRPKRTAALNEDLFDNIYKLAQMQFTRQEIYATLNIDRNEIERTEETKAKFEDVYTSGLNAGQGSLREKQFIEMMNGNSSLLIWLGKQYLKQSDNPIENTIASDLGTLKVEFVNAKEENQEERIKRLEAELDKDLK